MAHTERQSWTSAANELQATETERQQLRAQALLIIVLGQSYIVQEFRAGPETNLP